MWGRTRAAIQLAIRRSSVLRLVETHRVTVKLHAAAITGGAELVIFAAVSGWVIAGPKAPLVNDVMRDRAEEKVAFMIEAIVLDKCEFMSRVWQRKQLTWEGQ